jgi:ubiquitin-protein ligase
MTPRERRLAADLGQMTELAAEGVVSFRTEGRPADLYHLMLNVPGIAAGPDGQLTVRRLHRCDAYLHLDYPRRPPVITWLTPIFHPNLLPPERNGGVCIGHWSASESLADLCRRLVDLAGYRSLNAEDALDPEAAAWAREHQVERGEPVEELVRRAPSALAEVFSGETP